MLFNESDISIELNPPEFVQPVTGADKKAGRQKKRDDEKKNKERKKDSFEVSFPQDPAEKNEINEDQNMLSKIQVIEHSNAEVFDNKGGKIDIIIR